MSPISRKTYLQDQIKLISLNASDLFTEEEAQQYLTILKCKQELAELMKLKDADEQHKKRILSVKNEASEALGHLIAQNKGIVRKVNTRLVCDYRFFTDGKPPDAITWENLKLNKKICEFVSEQSRAMGVKADEVCLDKIILSWRSIDMLEQIVLNGFDVPFYGEDGNVVYKRFHFVSASAGQLRTDKIQALSDDIWHKIEPQLTCGLTIEEINKRGGINANKFMAYLSLPSSATEVWDFPIEKCIVIKDFEAPVTGVMDYIKPGYVLERGIYTVLINHCDGAGMALPGTLPTPNVMIRAPFVKGLVSDFDYLEFCRERNCKPIIEDFWGKEHDLIAEDIRVILTESQFKMAKYYDSWQDYVDKFHSCGCHLCCTNYEESWIGNTTINYQMLQTLVDFSDDEIKAFTSLTHRRIKNICRSKEAMLRVLGADKTSERPFLAALAIYNDLLGDGYSRDMLKAIKKRMLLDARSGAILCENKRLFAIPDLYAACEHWFLGEERPKGLLEDGYVYSPVFKNEEELDILRSPSLYMEHAIRKVSKDERLSKWFKTNGIYTSCHDLISRILQFDNDGDMLNCVREKVIIEAAKRNIKNMDIVPLFYDAYAAKKEQLNLRTLFNGLKRAHEYSGIGQVSNNLTKLWNRENPDIFAAACITRYNNAVNKIAPLHGDV